MSNEQNERNKRNERNEQNTEKPQFTLKKVDVIGGAGGKRSTHFQQGKVFQDAGLNRKEIRIIAFCLLWQDLPDDLGVCIYI